MKISARNALKEKGSFLTAGAVTSRVGIALPGGCRIVSIISKESPGKLVLRAQEDLHRHPGLCRDGSRRLMHGHPSRHDGGDDR
jgi:molybdopterin-binding protein